MSRFYNAYDLIRDIKKILKKPVDLTDIKCDKLTEIEEIIRDFETYEGEEI